MSQRHVKQQILAHEPQIQELTSAARIVILI
jgi:hypothetical protein